MFWSEFITTPYFATIIGAFISIVLFYIGYALKRTDSIRLKRVVKFTPTIIFVLLCGTLIYIYAKNISDSYIQQEINPSAKEAAEQARSAANDGEEAERLAEIQVINSQNAHNLAIRKAFQSVHNLLNHSAEKNPITMLSNSENDGEYNDIWINNAFNITGYSQYIDDMGAEVSVDFPAFTYYIGEYQGKQRFGIGVYRFYDFTTNPENYEQVMYRGYYMGSFSNDRYNGSGAIFWDQLWENRYFAGLWEDGYRVHGIHVRGENDYYIGQYEHDYYNGLGKRRWSSGIVYTGYWSEGYPDGIGAYTYPQVIRNTNTNAKKHDSYSEAVRYVGDVTKEEEEATGFGVITYMSGNYYEGKVYRLNRNGNGILYNTNGEIIEQGYWEMDEYKGLLEN